MSSSIETKEYYVKLYTKRDNDMNLTNDIKHREISLKKVGLHPDVIKNELDIFRNKHANKYFSDNYEAFCNKIKKPLSFDELNKECCDSYEYKKLYQDNNDRNKRAINYKDNLVCDVVSFYNFFTEKELFCLGF